MALSVLSITNYFSHIRVATNSFKDYAIRLSERIGKSFCIWTVVYKRNDSSEFCCVFFSHMDFKKDSKFDERLLIAVG